MKKIFSVIFAVMMMLLCCTGCVEKVQNDESGAKSLVIIIGKHANANMFDEDMLEGIRPYIEDSVTEYEDSKGYHAEADVSVIVCDGDPKKVSLVSEGKNILKCDAQSEKKFDEGKSKIVDDIIAFLSREDLKADDPEVDLLKAISQAQDILNSRKGTQHHILILDTGVTTSGYLDMRKIDVINSETADVISQIKEGIPSLKGTEVTVLGLGNVSGSQEELESKSAKDKFIALWTSVVETGEGVLTDELYISENFGEPMEYNEDDENGYPPVGTVFFQKPDGSIACNKLQIETKTETPEQTIAVKFHTSDLGFMPDTAVFRDANQAHHAINTISSELENFLNTTDHKIYVVGSIAKVTTPIERHNYISKNRAQAVADMLINEYNVPSDRIEIVDAGATSFSWRCANEDNGPSQENRLVAIISANTEDLVGELKTEGYIN